MKVQALSVLEKVELRDIWESEAVEFTPWLAEEQNLGLLAEALNLELGPGELEKNVGPFRADILCKEINSDHWVLIENQLELSDHSHLGQILTYAAGLDARIVIWIAKKFTEEHRAALDRLNAMIGSDGMRFFAVEIELWKIGNSAPAPKFNVVVQPNNWSSQIAEASRQIEIAELSETKKLQLEYWKELYSILQRSKSLRPQNPQPRHWIRFSIGRAGMSLFATVNSREECVAVELYLGGTEAKKNFQELLGQKELIEHEIGKELEWLDLQDKIASRIILRFKGADISDRDDWERQHSWITTTLESFKRAFGPSIKNLGFREAS